MHFLGKEGVVGSSPTGGSDGAEGFVPVRRGPELSGDQWSISGSADFVRARQAKFLMVMEADG